LPAGDTSIVFAPTDSIHFREVDGERLLGFRRDSTGRVTHLIAPISLFGSEFTRTMERRAWHDGPRFMDRYVTTLLIAPLLLVFVGWPITAFLARRRRRALYPDAPHKRRLRAQTALGLAILFTIFWAFFGFDFIVASRRMIEQSNGLVYGVPEEFQTLTFMPWVLAVLAFLMALAAIASWAARWWDGLRRTLYALVTVCAVLTIIFLFRWNYLPPVF